MTLTARAPGKVNRCLFLGKPRADGLHPLVSVVQPVSLADHLTLADGEETDRVECPGVEGPNLAAAALAAFRATTGWDGPPVTVHVAKHVPVAAGMGGGSADAAAALRLAAHASGIPIPDGIAMALGADVPAQLDPRRCLMTGAGEHVRPLPDGPPEAYVIVPSPHALATPDVFREADRLGLGRPAGELAELEESLRGGDLPDALAVNDLEPAALSLCPSIGPALDRLRAAGARVAMVSGSGPTVYGVFGDFSAAVAVATHIDGSIPAQPAGAGFASVYPRNAS
jgi:4-diphosphocytidyl-2-C-methyl-D-erythritol kinase